MTSENQLSLFPEPELPGATFGGAEPSTPPIVRNDPSDQAARLFATDPRHNVVLEASAGTGKTSVLVARYLNLLKVGVDPSHILAMTFTRQAAAEMRARIIAELRADAASSTPARARWDTLRVRLGEISISTVDAFCLSLLREFPLEADLDPGFSLADDTEVPRLLEEAVEQTLALGARMARDDTGVAMLLAQLGPGRARRALTHLLQRRLVVPSALHRFLLGAPPGLSGMSVCREAATRMSDRLGAVAPVVERLLDDGPSNDPTFALLARDLRQLPALGEGDEAAIRARLDRLRNFFLTQKGDVRKVFRQGDQASSAGRRRYRASALTLAAMVHDVLRGFDRDLNIVLAGAVQRLFGIAVSQYRRELDTRGQLDFSEVLHRAVELLRQMDEFAQSRYRLESRYHHVLVDEFQDTSRAQWELVSLLVKAWGEGSGLGEETTIPPTIFVVGDRKQSIYRFRDADVKVLRDAGQAIARLRPDADVHRTISHSFRSVRGVLAFVNDLFEHVGSASDGTDAFSYDASDRFPIDRTHDIDGASPCVALVVGDDVDTCAETVAAEVQRLLDQGRIRDKDGSGLREVEPSDVGILFRARASHREFERALGQRSIPTYVYKGLGFFDADEIKDVRALIRFLANPSSALRTAAFLRSRLAGISDAAVVACSGHLGELFGGNRGDPGASADSGLLLSLVGGMPTRDQARLRLLQTSVHGWLGQVDRRSPVEVVDSVLSETAYAYELRGPHVVQARENLKKMRAVIRRLQNRGYATMARVADEIDHLSPDISTAVVDAFDAVNLMTVHAAKGLEFPIVFLVDIGRGTGTDSPAVTVAADRGDGRPSVAVWPYRPEEDDGGARLRAQDVEETKRLLYVALTRARDRLYLSATTPDGRPLFNRGSFGSVLTPELTSLFAEASGAVTGTVEWTGPRHTHTLGVYG